LREYIRKQKYQSHLKKNFYHFSLEKIFQLKIFKQKEKVFFSRRTFFLTFCSIDHLNPQKLIDIHNIQNILQNNFVISNLIFLKVYWQFLLKIIFKHRKIFFLSFSTNE